MPDLQFDFGKFLEAVMSRGLDRTLKKAAVDLAGLTLKTIARSARARGKA